MCIVAIIVAYECRVLRYEAGQVHRHDPRARAPMTLTSWMCELNRSKGV